MGFILFCLTPILPVKQTHAEFTWPQGNDLTSINAPLISYMPQDVDITLPIKEIQDLNPGATTALSTLPEDARDASLRGLFIRSNGDGIDVITRNSVPLSLTKEQIEKLPDNAVLRLTSNFEQTRAWVPDATNDNGEPLEGALNSDFRPMITGIYSEMRNTPETYQAAEAHGINVHVTVDTRFSSAPTLLKSLAMILGIVMTIIALWSLHRIDSLDGRRAHRFLPRRWWKPRFLDFIVVGTLLIWFIIGANTADDGYILNMTRLAEHSGYMANYYRWYGVPESPFGFPFYDLLALMTKVSTASPWIRLPSLLAGIITWLVLSREVLPRLGTRINQRRVTHWTMASGFLIFWLVYNNGTRPEPIIAMTSLLAWVSFERAIATHRLLPAAIGTILATLALSAGPTGLMAVAALLVSLSHIVRIAIRRLPALGAEKGESFGKIFTGMLAQIAPFLAAGTAILIGVFGDQTLRSVVEATRVRSTLGPSLPWYEEYIRYTALLEPTTDGSLTRRYAVLILFFSFGVVIASILRNGRVPGATRGSSTRLALVMLGTMFFMTFTPTKWTHHFGVYAGVGAAMMGLSAVAASYFSLRSPRNRWIFIGGVLMVFALALSGENAWWYVSALGVPWYDRSISLFGIEASTAMLALSLVVLVWGVLVGYFTDFRKARAESRTEKRKINADEARRTLKFQGLATAPIGVLTAAMMVFSVLSLAKGFTTQWPAYSVAKGNLVSLTGNSCQMANDVLVETDTNESFLQVSDGSPLQDSLSNDTSPGFAPNNLPTHILPDDTEKSGTNSQSSVREEQIGTTTDTPHDNATSNNKEDNAQNNHDSNNSTNAAGDTANAPAGGDNNAAGGDAHATVDNSQPTSSDDADEASSADDPNASGSTGGVTTKRGINGSYAKLPFELDRNKVPVLGSFTSGPQIPAKTITKWYNLPELNEERPLIVFTAAGRVNHYDMNGVHKYGQKLVVEFGHIDDNTDRSNPDSYQVLGEYMPLDIGTGPEWRNMRVPKEAVPANANVIRIVADDTNLTPDQWLALTPPRAPKMDTLNDVIGSEKPGLLDWPVGLQFPCQRTYDHNSGVTEVAQFRISSDHSSRRDHGEVMGYNGGGSLGLVQMTSRAMEMSTYLRDDWQRDWGVLDYLEPYTVSTGEKPKTVELQEHETTETGFYYPGPMRYGKL
ncbi:arabinosyltransferase [Corynebacterium anserum]|uniref:Arabinosyltransferase n=1 Tax=Corynebacterium anserum TaxID=2684406 RepID=A0A7G7YQQ8_9CORY|nr:arabinosyltransferase [Corynebacterium anserum]